MKTARKIAPSIQKAVGAEGINIIMNNEPAAGQMVFHSHVHIVPRFGDDGFRHWSGTPYKEGGMEKIGEKIRKELSAQ
jgi:histidine triad (HIT) family protein